ncbi:FlgD immunoglobulin-like domain containing protein [Streptomyces sp. LZ34]
MRRPARPLLAVVAALVAAATATATGSASAADTPLPIQTDGVWGIDFAGGTLATVEYTPSGDQYVLKRKVAPDGSTASARVPMEYAGEYADGDHIKSVPCDAGDCIPLVGSGNGDIGYVFVDENGKERVRIQTSPNTYHGVEPAVTGARIVDVTGRYFLYNAQSPKKQYLDDIQPYRTTDVRITRSITAASVWGTRLWAASSTAGTVTQTDIKTKTLVETVSTGAPCVIKELQVMGRWVYWSCGTAGPAGVYDRTAKKSFAVPSGPALVGDGYLVRHDRTAGQLLLTDFHTGAATAPRPIADLPAGNTADQRRLTWAVDKWGGDISYVDSANAIHVVPSGVPTQSLAKIESDVDGNSLHVENPRWGSTWQFNKPVTWTFTVKNASGRTVRTLTGSGSPEADVAWDGKTDTGTQAPNGRHTWTLTAKAVEGAGTSTTTGQIGVSGTR